MKNDFETACELINKKFSAKETENILQTGTDIEKTAVILNLETIDNEEIAELLIRNLTNQSGPVREAVAFKLAKFMSVYNKFFQNKNSLDIIINSLNDVNPNVVRFMIDTLKYLEDKTYILNVFLIKINNLLNEISTKPRRGKIEEHIFTKKCFKIYWSLEVIKNLIISENNIIIENENIKETFFNQLMNIL